MATKTELDYLRLISDGEVVIGPTDGEKTITQALKVVSYVDPSFTNYMDVKGQSTQNTPVQVYELVREGTATQIFESLGVDLNQLCLTQSQIIQFMRDGRDWVLYYGDSVSFLFKVNDEPLVVCVGRGSDGLGGFVYHLSKGGVLLAKSWDRFVVPQL